MKIVNLPVTPVVCAVVLGLASIHVDAFSPNTGVQKGPFGVTQTLTTGSTPIRSSATISTELSSSGLMPMSPTKATTMMRMAQTSSPEGSSGRTSVLSMRETTLLDEQSATNDGVNGQTSLQRSMNGIEKSITALKMNDGTKRLVSTIAVAGALAGVGMFMNPGSALADGGLGSIMTSASSISTSAASFLDTLPETGFYQAFSLVFVSEIGDKTFFIAGLLAMKTSRVVSYLGSMGALIVMTILSVLIGQIFHAVPSGIAQGIPLDDVAAVLAFTFFGYKTLKEAFEMDADGGVMDEELAEAEETVEGSDTVTQDTPWAQIVSTFALVFAAEFGDRSFLSTIALSAAQNPLSVAGGAIAAHGLATGIAVSGGSFVAKYVSEKVIGFIGGSLFIVFALTTALGIF